MLKQIKQKKGMNGAELAHFIGVTIPTLYSWESKNTWPLWALEKCGMTMELKLEGSDMENAQNARDEFSRELDALLKKHHVKMFINRTHKYVGMDEGDHEADQYITINKIGFSSDQFVELRAIPHIEEEDV